MQQQRTLTTHQSTGVWTWGLCGVPRPFSSQRKISLSHCNSVSREDSVVEVAVTQQLHGECNSSSSGQQLEQQLPQQVPQSSSSSMQQQRQQSGHSSNWMVLPAVAMHQLSMSLHMPAHAAEGVSPAALVLFREFLVGVLHVA